MQGKPPFALTTTTTIKILLLALGLSVAVLVISDAGLLFSLKEYLENVHPLVFLLLMLILPVAGAPISIFLVLLGLKFGAVTGILLAAVIMLAHMVASYVVMHSFLRRHILDLLVRLRVPQTLLQRAPNHWHALVFMLIPGVPYAAKNYLLAMTGMSPLPYLAINWIAQFGMSIPVILLSGAVMKLDAAVVGIALALLLGAWLMQQYVRKRYQRTTVIDSPPDLR